MPESHAILHARLREGITCVAERRGHTSFAIGMRLLIDLEGFLLYATGREGEVTESATALWSTHPGVTRDEVMMDLLDTCRRIVGGKLAGDYWTDFIATVRGALVS